MTYLPPLPRQLNGFDANGRYSCSAYACAAVIAYDTQGRQRPTGMLVRAWTNEPTPDSDNPGLTLAQVAGAAKHWGVTLAVRYRMPWSDFTDALKAGHGAILQVSYGPIGESAFSGSETFRGGHALAVFPRLLTMDPLADGRRGLFKGPAKYPEWLLRRSAGLLVVGTFSGRPIVVGDGYVYAAITPHAYPVVAPDVHYHFGGEPKRRGVYVVVKGGANVRTEPSTVRGAIVEVLKSGTLWYVGQTTETGQGVGGNRRWFGSLAGNRWISATRLAVA